MAHKSDSVTITIPSSSAAVALEVLLDEEARDRTRADHYTRRWHRQQLIEALQKGMAER